MNLEKYRLLFVDEATDHLDEMSRSLSGLDAEREGVETARALDTLFRMAHSIKGMAASLEYDAIAALTHRLEDWLEPLRESGVFPRSALPLLCEAVRALEEMVGVIAETGGPPAPRGDLIHRLSRTPETPEAPPGPPAPAGWPDAPPVLVAPPLPPSVRVRTRVVDRFLAAVGELVQRQSRLEKLHRESPFWELHREFGEELESMARVVRELRRRVLDLRTTPVRRVLDRLPRVASELAQELGKRVRLELRGEETEADRAVVDHLDGPLLHLLRNAVDHGIEPPGERERAGKDPRGRICLRASTARGRLVVCLEDDGRGIDIEAVRGRAIQRGLLREEVAEDLPPERICELVFEPGLSTRDTVNRLSGRGVGLDAVKQGIEHLGGAVSVESRPGQGSAFRIELSSMVALQRVLVLEVGGERVVLPVAPVQAVLSIEEGQVERAGSEAFFVWKDEPMPLLDLAERLGLPPPPAPLRGDVLMIETHGFRLGLRVDRAAADLEVFVREVPPVLVPIKPLGGVAVLPDGAPVFLLEVGILVEEFL